jgi:cytochrome b
MKIKPIASNQTELHTNSGAVVLFSYQTPVAAQLAEGGFVRTSTKWSKTTSKHITQWLNGAKAREVS